ncbi:metal ABC transporter permease [Candidatus Palibaumannia cicadellinicola]|uniref:Zinc (Metal cation) ABC transporter, inner membrane permease protein ZnuB n=1 Tax=Candidatus Palibaumannia cicadellinicola TaxID=186490 RepID=A0A088MXI0_9GAMM|nr:metal ABC transporter permease [Candidatus Baumannia cicadellinicola]AIN47007.1 Zinc (metal cation) ABC transporter, inner membrane permease protein ZnuB [Candidatus Baumannia cicadellinicola]
MINHLLDPFISYGFMRRALVACFALSFSTTPLGVFLLLRRMSLVGDALSHAILPGVAIGYLVYGMSRVAMGIGGFIAGVVVAVLSGWVSTMTPLKEDASFAGFYLGSLALGVILVSLRGSSVDLEHLLFGSILSIDNNAIYFIGIIASITFLTLALLYRALVVESFDAAFLRVNSTKFPCFIQSLFLALVVLNLVTGFQILGTMMSVGMMILPAIAAYCWTNWLPYMFCLATIIGLICSWCGLSWSFYSDIPAGPTIVLIASIFFLFSVLVGPRGGKALLFRRHSVIVSKEKK